MWINIACLCFLPSLRHDGIPSLRASRNCAREPPERDDGWVLGIGGDDDDDDDGWRVSEFDLWYRFSQNILRFEMHSTA